MLVYVFIIGYKSGFVARVFIVFTVLFPTVLVLNVSFMCLKVSHEFDLKGAGYCFEDIREGRLFLGDFYYFFYLENSFESEKPFFYFLSPF